jgi:excisionase family DNA binding protein
VTRRNAASMGGGASASPSHEARWLSAKEAADYLGVSTRTVYECCRAGLRHVRISDTPGGVLRFRRTWLDAWMESRAIGGGR